MNVILEALKELKNEWLNSVPAPYDKYYEIDNEDYSDEGGYKVGDEVEHYNMKIKAFLKPKAEYEDIIDIYPVIVEGPDAGDFPVVELANGRAYSVSPNMLEAEIRNAKSPKNEELKKEKNVCPKCGKEICECGTNNIAEGKIYISKAEMKKLDDEFTAASKDVAQYNISLNKNYKGDVEPDFSDVSKDKLDLAKKAYERYVAAKKALPNRSQDEIIYTDE